ncbi:BamA/TamA family outer membrane protein [Mucilaginibacter sp. HC2]|uniref:BamA/TamA family outer membrane protein n=1 Tax=Mucilaginibacter inviolabilis TaxID=2714892 RepID=UPI00140D9C63|nr:BamA/TamA family outer membrane protein [Mucilaginibacter inviolabilis]NHA02174.1 BamA/TamA family outer membrane protein [Mucilaginibacter inviolabilis]
MIKKIPSLLVCLAFVIPLRAQEIAPSAWQKFPDSTIVKIHPSYNDVTGIHRWLFGTNFRKEWAIAVKLPVIRLSQVNGGLTTLKQGGGMQSKSLRLEDKTGREWVLRSVEKVPDKLLPEGLQGTFAIDWVSDEFSAQHPYSALIVPPLAVAARVPHANPVIGVVADDPALGQYSKIFTNTVCLLEEREPIGESDNTFKMQRELTKSYANRVDGEAFLRARMLDLLIGDWDRHEDQWRWAVTKEDKARHYVAVPRDRDQVFHVNQGLFPSIAALPWIDPLLGNFEGDLSSVKYSLFKTRFMKQFPDAQVSYDEWMRIVNDFVKAETDQVLEAGLKRLPKETYDFRHQELLSILKKRRDNMPAAMAGYYRFINRIVDLHTTDKDEQITVSDAPNKGMRVTVEGLNKKGETKNTVWDMTYQPDITQELRLYTGAGNDHIVINNASSPIKLRIIDSVDDKTFDVKQSNSSVKIYGPKDSTSFTGNVNRLSKHLSTDTLNSRFVPANLYNVWMPLATAAINADDGFLLGLGFKYKGVDGFRKLPYSTIQQVMITHSFATDAFRIKYNGEWIQAIGKADFTMQAYVQAPDNTMNFFGRGNDTKLTKFPGYRRFYRARFNTYQLDPALRWHTGKGSTFSAGPSLQFYHMNLADNVGKFISLPTTHINSYDSATLNKDKAHVGLILNYISNRRNNNILPSGGFYFNVLVQGYTGLNSYSKSFMQIKPEFTYYQKLNSAGTIVLSDRVGGGVTVGDPAFYQSLFLGGQGNLLGFLQNRFAGQQMVFNNLQGRVKLAKIASYILPGELGLTGFYDTGRVWIKDEHSDTWHQGVGGGLYFSPAGLTIVQLLAGHSNEGWYPYISLNFRI